MDYPINYMILSDLLRQDSYTQDNARWAVEALNKMCNAYDEVQDQLAELRPNTEGD